jgi:hypothetical protein
VADVVSSNGVTGGDAIVGGVNGGEVVGDGANGGDAIVGDAIVGDANVGGVSSDARSRGDVVALLEQWTTTITRENPVVTNVERDTTCDRWFVRVRGEEKLVTTVWFTVREETLAYETYFMPSPEENVAAVFEYLLRANIRFYGLRFAIGQEDAVYLVGQTPFRSLRGADGIDELDRILGAAYAYSEECFRTAMQIGFASRFSARNS